MTPRATIAALRRETEALLARINQDGSHCDAREAVDLIARCRAALTMARDDGLGPWESPELEYAMHIASRHDFSRLALICACEVLVIGERSLGAMGDHGFFGLLA